LAFRKQITSHFAQRSSDRSTAYGIDPASAVQRRLWHRFFFLFLAYHKSLHGFENKGMQINTAAEITSQLCIVEINIHFEL
jgi:hypothetical protein